jgi:hypothetical protein
MCTSTWSGEKTVPATIATVGTACTSAMVPALLHNVSQKADMCARWSHSCAQGLGQHNGLLLQDIKGR